MDYAQLKARHRAERDGHDETLSLRLHRALSWLDRAEQLADDPDSQFIFLWIAFNAACAADIDDSVRLSEQTLFRDFLRRQATLQVLVIAISRVYTVRNQLLHGAATWNGKVNRHQVRDCTRMMARFVPLVIEIMLDHPQAKWPKPSYPVIVGT